MMTCKRDTQDEGETPIESTSFVVISNIELIIKSHLFIGCKLSSWLFRSILGDATYNTSGILTVSNPYVL